MSHLAGAHISPVSISEVNLRPLPESAGFRSPTVETPVGSTINPISLPACPRGHKKIFIPSKTSLCCPQRPGAYGNT
ncbi:hypothetical protein GN956_G11913 [Arapaima gigas]